MSRLENESDLGGKVRVHRIAPELSDRLLGKNSRAHLVRYSGYIGVSGGPYVMEMFNIHGDETIDQVKRFKEGGSSGMVLKEGDSYTVENINRDPNKDPHGLKQVLYRVHRHPDSI